MPDELLDDVWSTRDRPVLVEVVRRLEQEMQYLSTSDVAEATGLSADDVSRAARNLALADLATIDARGSLVRGFTGIRAPALRIAGLWPDAGDAVDRVLWALAEREAAAPSEDKGRFKQVREAIVGLGRDVSVEILGAAITGRLPL